MSSIKRMNLFNEPERIPGVLPFETFSSKDVYKVSLGTTSKGNQEKYKTYDGRFYVKTCFEFEQHLWKDNLVEVVASQYAYQCLLPPDVVVVRQGLCKLGVQNCSYSEAFDLDGKNFIPFSRALGDNINSLAKTVKNACTVYDWFSILVEYYSDFVGYDASGYLVTMMLLDLVVANEDRHLSNFGFLRDEGQSAMTPSVLFDFGLGLFEHTTAYYSTMPLERALKKIRIKPWNAKVSQTLSFLEQYHSNLISAILPVKVDVSQYSFPSALAKSYFVWVNERLGVKIVGV